MWQAFLTTTGEGQTASVLIAHYDQLDPQRCSEEYYEIYKEDYPTLSVDKLSYDGNCYTIEHGDYDYTNQYQYLLALTVTAPSSASFDSSIYYILTDDNTVTSEDLRKQITNASSLGSGGTQTKYFNYDIIYIEHIYNEK